MASLYNSLYNSIAGFFDTPARRRARRMSSLRPRTSLQKISRLPTTPTKAHQPPAVREKPKTDVSNRKCPHCKGTLYVNFKSGRITKPNNKAKGRGQKAWIRVKEANGDEFMVEDRSPRGNMKPKGMKKYY